MNLDALNGYKREAKKREIEKNKLREYHIREAQRIQETTPSNMIWVFNVNGVYEKADLYILAQGGYYASKCTKITIEKYKMELEIQHKKELKKLK